MPTLLFYQEPVALNREEHKNLRLKKQDTTEFAKKTNSVPLAGFEFFEASREIPVLFTKDSSGDFLPMAILSLKPDGNSISDNWGDVYMPSFIRRYPFALSQDGTVIFDKQAPHLQEEDGDRLFDEEKGENTEVLNSVVSFLNYVDQQFKVTNEFCKACVERDLFEPFNVQVNVEEGKPPVRLNSLFVLSEKKLNDLKDEDVTEFFRKGWMAWAYAHLHSLSAVGRLVRRDRRAAATADPEQA